VDAGDVADNSEVYAASISNVEVCRLASFSVRIYEYIAYFFNSKEDRGSTVMTDASSGPVGTTNTESCGHLHTSTLKMNTARTSETSATSGPRPHCVTTQE
jgi:hypothetical protein